MADDEALGIYDDLDEFHDEQQRKSKEVQVLQDRLDDAIATIEEKQAVINGLHKKLHTIQKNLYRLLETAKDEIKRKDQTIIDLRRDLDNLHFRRQQSNRWREYQNQVNEFPNPFNMASNSQMSESTYNTNEIPYKAVSHYKDDTRAISTFTAGNDRKEQSPVKKIESSKRNRDHNRDEKSNNERRHRSEHKDDRDRGRSSDSSNRRHRDAKSSREKRSNSRDKSYRNKCDDKHSKKYYENDEKIHSKLYSRIKRGRDGSESDNSRESSRSKKEKSSREDDRKEHRKHLSTQEQRSDRTRRNDEEKSSSDRRESKRRRTDSKHERHHVRHNESSRRKDDKKSLEKSENKSNKKTVKANEVECQISGVDDNHLKIDENPANNQTHEIDCQKLRRDFTVELMETDSGSDKTPRATESVQDFSSESQRKGDNFEILRCDNDIVATANCWQDQEYTEIVETIEISQEPEKHTEKCQKKSETIDISHEHVEDAEQCTTKLQDIENPQEELEIAKTKDFRKETENPEMPFEKLSTQQVDETKAPEVIMPHIYFSDVTESDDSNLEFISTVKPNSDAKHWINDAEVNSDGCSQNSKSNAKESLKILEDIRIPIPYPVSSEVFENVVPNKVINDITAAGRSIVNGCEMESDRENENKIKTSNVDSSEACNSAEFEECKKLQESNAHRIQGTLNGYKSIENGECSQAEQESGIPSIQKDLLLVFNNLSNDNKIPFLPGLNCETSFTETIQNRSEEETRTEKEIEEKVPQSEESSRHEFVAHSDENDEVTETPVQQNVAERSTSQKTEEGNLDLLAFAAAQIYTDKGKKRKLLSSNESKKSKSKSKLKEKKKKKDKVKLEKLENAAEEISNNEVEMISMEIVSFEEETSLEVIASTPSPSLKETLIEADRSMEQESNHEYHMILENTENSIKQTEPNEECSEQIGSKESVVIEEVVYTIKDSQNVVETIEEVEYCDIIAHKESSDQESLAKDLCDEPKLTENSERVDQGKNQDSDVEFVANGTEKTEFNDENGKISLQEYDEKELILSETQETPQDIRMTVEEKQNTLETAEENRPKKNKKKKAIRDYNKNLKKQNETEKEIENEKSSESLTDMESRSQHKPADCDSVNLIIETDKEQSPREKDALLLAIKPKRKSDEHLIAVLKGMTKSPLTPAEQKHASSSLSLGTPQSFTPQRKRDDIDQCMDSLFQSPSESPNPFNSRTATPPSPCEPPEPAIQQSLIDDKQKRSPIQKPEADSIQTQAPNNSSASLNAQDDSALNSSSESRRISIGSSQYVIEKISENEMNFIVTRKRKKKKKKGTQVT